MTVARQLSDSPVHATVPVRTATRNVEVGTVVVEVVDVDEVVDVVEEMVVDVVAVELVEVVVVVSETHPSEPDLM